MKAEIIKGKKKANPAKFKTVSALRYMPAILIPYEISLFPNQ